MKIDSRIARPCDESRLVHFGDHDELAVGRRDDELRTALAGSLGIAEEVGDPEGEQQ